MRMISNWGAALVACGLSLAVPAAAQVDLGAGEKLGAVAQAIVDRAVARSVHALAILPFTLPDGSCTSLSSYLADEMVVRLFALDALTVEVVDRQNLTAIVTEAGLGDILDPAAGREFGRISGVDAFVVGSLTLSADMVQVTVRLISIDARVLGAAATAIARTSTIDELLSQPIEGAMFCGRAGPSPVAAGATRATDTVQGLGGLAVSLESVTVAGDGADAGARLRLSNETDAPLAVMGIHPRLSLSDGRGNLIAFDVAIGLHNCDYSDVFDSPTNSADNCNVPRSWRRATVLPPGATHIVTLRGTRDEDYEAALGEGPLDLSGSLLVRGAEVFVVSVNFPGIAPE
jgi:hypothetical protein